MVSAASKSEATSTFHMTASESMRSISGTPDFAIGKVTLSGDVDLATNSVHLTGTLAGGSLGPGKAPEDFSLEVIQIGTDSWESTSGLGGLGQLGGSLPPGHWIKDDASSPVSQFPDPGKLFELLKSKATKVRFVGTATIDGAATDQYQLLGPPNLVDTLGGGSSDQSEATGPVSIQVWVDQSNLVRRLSAAYAENMGPPGQVEGLTVSVDFSKYGEPLHIAPPPSSLVVPNS